MEVTEITKKLVLVGVDVRCPSGTIKRDDNPDSEKEVFTAGSVRYIAPDVLRPFAAARQATMRICRSYGTRFWGAWAVPEESIPALSKELEGVAARVNKHKADVIADWEVLLEKWASSHMEAVAPYRLRFPKKDAADRGIGISISAVRITPSEKIVGCAEDAVEVETLGMPMRILEEVAQDVKDSWQPGAQKATQAIKGLLNRIRLKCATLAFVGGNLGEVAKFVETTIESLPASGEIVGNDFLRLAGFLSLMMRPEMIAQGNFAFSLSQQHKPSEEDNMAISLAEEAEADCIKDPEEEAESPHGDLDTPEDATGSTRATNSSFGW